MANYAVYTNDKMDNDYADWYTTCEDALSAAQKLSIENEAVTYIMKFDEDGECDWNECIEVDEYGKAWSDDYGAREEMGCIQ